MQNPGSYEKKFYLALTVFAALVFALNWNHANQQGIFYNEFVPIAKHLLSGDGYVIHTGMPVLYPIWGYTFLTLVGELFHEPVFFLAGVQIILCLIGISFFYKFFSLEKRIWHIPFFLPFIALLSVRWPDAIVATLLIIAAYTFKKSLEIRSKKYSLISGILFGIILNFRSEYFGLLLVLALVAILALFLKKRFYFALFTITVLSALFMMLPWAYYSYSIDKHLRLSATNGGGVLYISLGQLPNNPWGISHSDSTAYAVAKQNGISDPYTARGDSLLTSKFIDDVEKEPLAYSEKAGYNLFTSFIRGVYVGEYTDIVEKAMKIIFILIFDLLLLLTFFYLGKNFKKSFALSIILFIILYKFALISLIQYEPRHMNGIYLFILGTSLLYFEDRKKSLLSNNPL